MEAGSSAAASASASALNMQLCDSKLWLMKVPNFLLEHWMTREDGRPTEVGVVKETVGPDGKKSMTLQLSEQGDYLAEWPREYNFGLDVPLTSMHVFSSDAKGQLQLNGRVEKRVPTVPTVPVRRLSSSRHPAALLPSHHPTTPPPHPTPPHPPRPAPGRGEAAGAEQTIPRDHEAPCGA